MTVRIEIDDNRCTGCKICVKSCRYGVLEWLDDAPIVVNLHEYADCLTARETVRSKPLESRSRKGV